MAKNYLIIIFIICLSLFQIVFAIQEFEVKIVAADGARGDEFGRSVSISGDYAIVSAPEDSDNGQNSGSVYIFVRDDQDWIQQEKIMPDDAERRDFFGYSVSISGDYAIVGAYGDGDNGERSGSAYIFIRENQDWIQQEKITANDGEVNDFFGMSVSIDGDYAIIGAYGDDDDGEQSGSAYIFMRDGEDWIQQEKIVAGDAEGTAFFGSHVSISGDYAIVGAYGDDENGNYSGSAYTFVRNDEDWVQQEKLFAEDGEAGDLFGRSVSVNGDYAIVGSVLDDDVAPNSGAAYIYFRDGQDWLLQEKITSNNGRGGEQFGFSVSIMGDHVIVGAHQQNDNGIGSGSAYLFHHNGREWIQQENITADDGNREDGFGFSVSINSDYMIIGAFLDEDNGDRSGSAYIYTFQELVTDPVLLDFGEVIRAHPAVRELDIIYGGIESDLTIAEISTGTDFFAVDFVDDISIEPGDTARIQIMFSPDSIRIYNDTLTIVTDNIYIGEQSLVLVGVGVQGNSIIDKLTTDIPSKYILFKAYPNPFNSTTTISYNLPQTSNISLKLYDISGRLISQMFNGRQQVGIHTTTVKVDDWASGLYFIRLESMGQVFTQKVMLIR